MAFVFCFRKYLIFLPTVAVSVFLFTQGSLAGDQLKVLSFNVWAVPVPGVSKDTDERFALMPAQIAETSADVVVLQEAWKDSRKENLITGLKDQGYEYAVFGDPSSTLSESWGVRGMLGNGLVIVSRYPLDQDGTKIMKFSTYTRADEYPIFKGAIKTRVNVPGIGWIDLVASHLGAFTTETKEVDGKDVPDHMNERHLHAKLTQAQELKQFIEQNKTSETVLLVMDLNTHYFKFLDGEYDATQITPEYALMTCQDQDSAIDCLNYIDSFTSLNGVFGRDADTPRPFTYDTEQNDYAKDGEFATEPPGVIDYIMTNNTAQLTPVQSNLLFTERISDKPKYLSDHYGLMTIFEIVE